MSLNQKDKSNLESVFGGKTIFSTVYIIGNFIPIETIVDKINLTTKSNSLLASCSSLPYDSGIIVRMLADSVSEIISLTESISDILRNVTKKNYKIKPIISNSSIDTA